MNHKEYRICEIEFYLYDPRTPGTFITPHEDAYTHRDPDQKLNGHWYFHKHKTGTFKGGTFKGRDLIIGDGKQYCGVVIRSIYDMANKKLIAGPCCSVNTVLENYKVSSISELYDSEKTLRLTNNFRNFVLKRKGLSPEPIYKGIRIGLSDKYPDEIETMQGVFKGMVDKVYKREEVLRQQLRDLKIEIDQSKRQKQVSEIVDSEFFQDLRTKAQKMRDQQKSRE